MAEYKAGKGPLQDNARGKSQRLIVQEHLGILLGLLNSTHPPLRTFILFVLCCVLCVCVCVTLSLSLSLSLSVSVIYIYIYIYQQVVQDMWNNNEPYSSKNEPPFSRLYERRQQAIEQPALVQHPTTPLSSTPQISHNQKTRRQKDHSPWGQVLAHNEDPQEQHREAPPTPPPSRIETKYTHNSYLTSVTTSIASLPPPPPHPSTSEMTRARYSVCLLY